MDIPMLELRLQKVKRQNEHKESEWPRENLLLVLLVNHYDPSDPSAHALVSIKRCLLSVLKIFSRDLTKEILGIHNTMQRHQESLVSRRSIAENQAGPDY